jgi:hypothetical protein
MFVPEHIHPDTWPAIHAVLAPGIARGDYTTAELVDELIENTAQLWVLRKGGDPIAAAVSELVETPLGRIVHGRLCAGTGMPLWIDDLIATIRGFAEEVGAYRITVDGRAGWRTVLESRGWRLASVTMALDLVKADA